MKKEKQISIPENLEGYHYKAFAEAIMSQLKNPKLTVDDIDLDKAAKEANLPTSIDPRQLAESDAFSFVLDNVGLTEEFLAEALFEDIVNKPGNRVQEMKLAFQVRGLTESRKVDPNVAHAKNIDSAMNLMEKLIDNKITYEQDPVTGDYKPTK